MKPKQPQPQQTAPIGAEKKLRLFAGIELAYLSLAGERFTVHHEENADIMVINYCKSGRIGWRMTNGSYAYLGAGDFCVHTLNICANSEITLPNETYEGLAIYIDLQQLTDNPPDLLQNTGITGDALYNRLCGDTPLISVIGNEHTEAIFRFFFQQPAGLRPAYQKIKVLELLLYLYTAGDVANRRATEYQAEQIETVRKIHDQLLNSLDQRITIEELSRRCMMNPTTMKSLFKSVYGTSIAAHMKEHRMRKAAELLSATEMTIAEVALAVGYDSQSKFSAAFKDYFRVLPKEYRKRR